MISIYIHSTGRFYTNAIGDSDTEEFKALIYIWIGKTLAKLGKLVLSQDDKHLFHHPVYFLCRIRRSTATRETGASSNRYEMSKFLFLGIIVFLVNEFNLNLISLMNEALFYLYLFSLRAVD